RPNQREKVLVPRSAWEHYSLGRYDLRAGRLKQAAEAFQAALELRPHDFWPNFYHAICSCRLHHFDDAVADFRACLAIEPRSAIVHFNLALAYDAAGRTELARRAYSTAIDIAPELMPARLNRGVLSYKAGRFAEAVADFDVGLAAGPDRET